MEWIKLTEQVSSFSRSPRPGPGWGSVDMGMLVEEEKLDRCVGNIEEGEKKRRMKRREEEVKGN